MTSDRPNLHISVSSHTVNGRFPAMSLSPTTAAPVTESGFNVRSARSSSTASATSTVVSSVAPSLKSRSASVHSPAGHLVSRINFEGSWLDLESDSDGEKGRGSIFGGRLMHRRRKSSLGHSSTNGSDGNGGGGGSGSGSGLGANLKEMTRRSSMHFRKLASKMGSSTN
ncbi:hypothetical protein LPJ53_006081 [Coemansia erecta]|uniref:Uncharacterized protein n=1 Tax=Coemansia erecta TaxID=147472 RepID=A0A9W7XV52_9FUNG|nr:hypothetical protein LPJ53_006081 [Coemansia erecta]